MTFDAQSFLDMSVTDSNSTEFVPVPEGDYVAIAEKIDVRPWQKKDDPSVAGLTLEVHWAFDATPELKEQLGRDKITVKQGVMLDLTESGGLDMGKGRNVSLGKLRAALDLNNPGQAFSFNQIPGRPAKVQVKHRIHEGAIYAEVKAVAHI